MKEKFSDDLEIRNLLIRVNKILEVEIWIDGHMIQLNLNEIELILEKLNNFKKCIVS